MKTIREPARDIPVLMQTDVLVVGGGPSGLAAAIASAQAGVDTLLMDRYGCFGGVISQVGVEGVAWYRHNGQTVEAGGLMRVFEDTAKQMGGSQKEPQSDSEALDAEMFKVVADRMVLGAGVTPLLHCTGVQAIVEDGAITGIITESKSGRMAILAKRVIDCTGDADIAASAGAPFTKADKGSLMDVTQLFNLRGIDSKAFQRYVDEELKPTYRDWGGEAWSQNMSEGLDMFSPYIEHPFVRARNEGLIPREPNVSLGGTWSSVSPDNDITQMNMIFMKNYDCTDVRDLTEAEIKGREAAMHAITALQAYVPGFAHARLRNFGMTLGTRESRKIEGHYYLTEQDVSGQARFEDSIGIFPEFIDGCNTLVLPISGRYFQLPYRALLPKKVDNLLVAGRAISGDRIAHCAFRNMSCCVVTGQGAGVAAAMSVRSGKRTSEVDIHLVQEALKKQDVRID